MKFTIFIIFAFICFYSCNSSNENCYIQQNNIVRTKENSISIRKKSDIIKIKHPEKVRFLYINLSEKINQIDLYKFSNISSLKIRSNHFDFNNFKLSEFKNICSLEIIDKIDSKLYNLDKFFKNVHTLSYINLYQYGINNENLLTNLPFKINCLEITYDKNTSNQIDENWFQDIEIKQLIINTNYNVGNKFYKKKNNKVYPNMDIQFIPKGELITKIKKSNQFIEMFSHIKLIEELTINNMWLDSIVPNISVFKDLKKIQFNNCNISKLPSIENLAKLETITFYNEEEINKEFSYPVIKNNANFKGLTTLKNIYFFNINLDEFPEFSDSKNIKNLIFIGNNTVKEFPYFLKNSKKTLKTLIWNKSKINKIPNYLNTFDLDHLNIDNNKLKTIQNIIDVASNTNYFSYNINNVNYDKRKTFNNIIKNRKFNKLGNSNELSKIADSIYEGFQNNILYRKIVYGFQNNKGSFKYEIFLNENKKDKYDNYYDNKTIKDFYYYLNLSKKYNLDIGHLGFHKNCIELSENNWNVKNTNFNDFSTIIERNPFYPFYYKNSSNQKCVKEAKNENGFISNEKTYAFIYRNVPEINGMNTQRIANYKEQTIFQKEFNKIIKAKGLKNIIAKNIIIDSIPQSYYDLNLDTIEVKYFELKKSFPKHFKYPSSYFSTNFYGNIPHNIKYLYIGSNIKSFPENVSLPKLKVFVKELALNTSNFKNKVCENLNFYSKKYFKDTNQLDSVFIFTNEMKSKFCFSQEISKISKYLFIGYNVPTKLLPYGNNDYKGLGIEIINFPNFTNNAIIKELNIKGRFRNTTIPNSLQYVKTLKKIKLENIMINLNQNINELERTIYFPKINQIENLFKVKSLEELTLINFNINYLPKTLKNLKNLKRIILKNTDNEYSDISFASIEKKILKKIPKELLELNNLEEIHLEGNLLNLNLDFSKLPNLKKITIKGVKSKPENLIKKLEDKNITVNIIK